MKRFFILSIISILTLMAHAQYEVSGNPYVYNENLTGAGIEKIYLLNSLNGATITYASSALSVSFYRYQNSLSDKELIPASDISTSSSGSVTTYTISNLIDSRGYFVEENGGVKAPVWIIDYSIHQPVLTSISTVESEDKCENLKLYVTKSDELSFFTVNGSKRNISRRYDISYNNLEWDDKNFVFAQKTVELKDQIIGTDVVISAPLINTQFKLRGDQFAEHFGITQEISSDLYNAVAVEPHIVSEQQKRDAENELKDETESLGGSAPVTINFYGYSNEPVTAYYTWFIYNKKDVNSPIARYTDKDIEYTFQQWGDYTVQLEVADQASICVDTVSVSVNISESYLDAPNYFSPGDSPGINDEFRVAYKSLVKFKCTIFNRWGNKLYQWTDPSKGWDGKYKGNYVNTGVYFYVIEAEGSDGIKYKKSGDINVLRSR